MGIDTLGIDARKENLIKANYVKFNTRINDLNFALDDVRNLERHGNSMWCYVPVSSITLISLPNF